ncbi:MAG: hypothetical protein RMJ55_20425, partial [Roseiflexaceae bacterium]|nr:hypothetical protein [Roseiflexaceae bacterium]
GHLGRGAHRGQAEPEVTVTAREAEERQTTARDQDARQGMRAAAGGDGHLGQGKNAGQPPATREQARNAGSAGRCRSPGTGGSAGRRRSPGQASK